MESEDDDGDEVGSPSKSDSGSVRKAGRAPAVYKKYEARMNKLIEKQDAQ